MKVKILSLLKDTNEYISGQELCERFGVSRTAVWKAIKQLQAEGYQIEAVNNKGYHLVTDKDVFSKEEIQGRTHTSWLGKDIYYYKETGSTNNDVKRFAEEGAEHGLVVMADTQTGGRGRRGRVWQSQAGTSAMFSVLLRPSDLRPENASMLTLVAAMAIAKTVSEVFEDGCGIKWPNDVVVHKKKICGILTEMSANPDCVNYCVVGIGINVNQENFPEEIQDMATSLYIEKGEKCSRSAIVARVLDYFEEYYAVFMETQDMSRLQEPYNQILVNCNRTVKVLDPKGAYEGVAKGIDERGQLLVELESGEVEKVYAGEVSVRGLYGYVD